MMAELVASLPSAGIGAAAGAVAVTAIRALVQAFKISKDADGSRDGLQANRITELERRMEAEHLRCERRMDLLSNRIIVVAQSTMELSSVVEKHDPASPALVRAKLALQHAFPLDFDTPSDMLAKARKLGDEV